MNNTYANSGILEVIDLDGESNSSISIYLENFPDIDGEYVYSIYEKIYKKVSCNRSYYRDELSKFIFCYSFYKFMYNYGCANIFGDFKIDIENYYNLEWIGNFLDYFDEKKDNYKNIYFNNSSEIDFSNAKNIALSVYNYIEQLQDQHSNEGINIYYLHKQFHIGIMFPEKTFLIKKDENFFHIIENIYVNFLSGDIYKGYSNKDIIRNEFDTENLFPNIQVYKNKFKSITNESLLKSLFHRYNLLNTIKSIHDKYIFISNNESNNYDFISESEEFLIQQNIIDVVANIFKFAKDLYSSNPIEATFDFNFARELYLKNPFGSKRIKDLKDIIRILAENIDIINPATRLYWEELYGVGEISTGKYYNLMQKKSVYKDVRESFSTNYEKKAYKEFLSKNSNAVIETWTDEYSLLYILDVVIICKLFGLNIPNDIKFANLLNTENEIKIDRHIFKINIRLNDEYLLWLAYHIKYLTFDEVIR
ncbi:hypothetical protein IB683_07375 [Francisella philomiragia]|uniref:hypothetical protein n=1 Tax=Francisella philomiragia TaxID=28110 RepID=UPI001902D09E|nr:hypothetical protein [Francisella philomiragia]MBK2093730.1 hypothetical protein [Francisella philomiragia]